MENSNSSVSMFTSMYPRMDMGGWESNECFGGVGNGKFFCFDTVIETRFTDSEVMVVNFSLSLVLNKTASKNSKQNGSNAF